MVAVPNHLNFLPEKFNASWIWQIFPFFSGASSIQPVRSKWPFSTQRSFSVFHGFVSWRDSLMGRCSFWGRWCGVQPPPPGGKIRGLWTTPVDLRKCRFAQMLDFCSSHIDEEEVILGLIGILLWGGNWHAGCVFREGGTISRVLSWNPFSWDGCFLSCFFLSY